MTDAYLMDAECIHGNVWYDCIECDKEEEAKREKFYRERLVHPWED